MKTLLTLSVVLFTLTSANAANSAYGVPDMRDQTSHPTDHTNSAYGVPDQTVHPSGSGGNSGNGYNK